MEFKSARCPNCGGELQLPEIKDIVKCMYCASDIIVKEAINNFNKSDKDINNYIELAETAFTSGNKEEGLNFINKYLEYNPNNPKAWDIKTRLIILKYRYIEVNNIVREVMIYMNKAILIDEKYRYNLDEYLYSIVGSYSQYVNDLFEELTNNGSCTRQKSQKNIIEAVLAGLCFIISITPEKYKKNIVDYIYKTFHPTIYGYTDIDMSDNINIIVAFLKKHIPDYGKTNNACFIATATYNTPMANEVISLKMFRDQFLYKYSIGKLFIKLYYNFSPFIANFISDSIFLKFFFRLLLKPIVLITKLILRILNPKFLTH